MPESSCLFGDDVVNNLLEFLAMVVTIWLLASAVTPVKLDRLSTFLLAVGKFHPDIAISMIARVPNSSPISGRRAKTTLSSQQSISRLPSLALALLVILVG